jgi:hypothetical protein
MKQKTISLAFFLFFGITIYAQTSTCDNPTFKFNIPAREINCMRLFNSTASGANATKEFLLAKFSEMAYLERLDYQIRYMKNGAKTVSSIPSTDWIKTTNMVNNGNMECAFAARFAHYFYNESERPKKMEINIGQLNTNSIDQTVASQSIVNKVGITNTLVDKQTSSINPVNSQMKTVATQSSFESDSIAWVKENVPTFKFIRRTISAGFVFLPNLFSWDPELMLINSKYGIFIIFRGTDNVYNRSGDLGEWIGTNFLIAQSPIPGAPGKVHTGFNASYALVQSQIKNFLDTYAAPNKKIWVTGHSLGGGMAMLAGIMLKASGYPVQGIYTFGAPRVIGDDTFVSFANSTIPNLQRFEHYLDPITMAGFPGYKHDIGKRNWTDHRDYGNFKYYPDIEERRLGDALKNIPWGEFGYNPGIGNDHIGGDSPEKLETQRRIKTRLDANLINFLPPFTNIEIASSAGSRYTQMDRMYFGYHNPPYYVQAAYSRLSSALISQLPLVDNPWPYVYYDAPGAK